MRSPSDRATLPAAPRSLPHALRAESALGASARRAIARSDGTNRYMPHRSDTNGSFPRFIRTDAVAMRNQEKVVRSRLGHSQKWIGTSAEGPRAVAAGHPTLDHFVLLGDAGVVGEEHYPSLGIRTVLEARAVGHPPPGDPRHLRNAWIAASDMCVQRAPEPSSSV